jgi:hypothetical protein
LDPSKGPEWGRGGKRRSLGQEMPRAWPGMQQPVPRPTISNSEAQPYAPASRPDLELSDTCRATSSDWPLRGGQRSCASACSVEERTGHSCPASSALDHPQESMEKQLSEEAPISPISTLL